MENLTELDSEMAANFQSAANHVRKVLVGKLDTHQLLTLYALYKQATEGLCPSEKPRWYELQAKQKWEAWHLLGDMNKSKAMMEYVQKVEEFDPKWKRNEPIPETKDRSVEGWVTVSCLPNTDEVLQDCDKTVFDWLKEGDIQKVQDWLSKKSADVNVIDQEGMGLIHWAADRDNLEMLRVLVDEFNANVDLRDQEGQTALHYAASCGHVSVINYLLQKKADQSIADVYGMLPVHVGSSVEICSLFKSPEKC